MEVKMEVKIDNTFVYNIVAKSIVLFNSFFYFLFNSLLFSLIVTPYFLIVTRKPK